MVRSHNQNALVELQHVQPPTHPLAHCPPTHLAHAAYGEQFLPCFPQLSFWCGRVPLLCSNANLLIAISSTSGGVPL